MSGPPPPPRRRKPANSKPGHLKESSSPINAVSAVNAVLADYSEQRSSSLKDFRYESESNRSEEDDDPTTVGLIPIGAALNAVRQRSITDLVSSKESQNKYQDQHGYSNSGDVENAVTGQRPAPRGGGTETVTAATEIDPALLLRAMITPKVFTGKPETTIGKGVAVRGQLKFVRVLRVDGKFTGTLSSSGSVIIGPSGTLISDVSGLSAILVEGRLVGHVICDTVIIRSTGSIFGNVTCKSFFAENGSILVGTANIQPKAPLHVDADMNVVPGDGEFNVEMGSRMNSSVSVRSDTSGAAQFEASHREQSLAIEGSEAALSRQASAASLASNKSAVDLADASASKQGSKVSLGAGGGGQETSGLSTPSNVAVIDDAVNVNGDRVDVDGNPIGIDNAVSTSLLEQKSASPMPVAASPTGSKVSLAALSPNESATQLAASSSNGNNTVEQAEEVKEGDNAVEGGGET